MFRLGLHLLILTLILISPRLLHAEVPSVRVEGNDDCHEATDSALEALALNVPHLYRMVNRNVSVVECLKKGSGVAPWQRPIRVSIGDETRTAGKIWYASVLVHEACHVVQYRNNEDKNPNGKFGSEYLGKTAEAACLKPQKDVLEALGADQSTLEYIDTVLDTKYWDVPYDERWW